MNHVSDNMMTLINIGRQNVFVERVTAQRQFVIQHTDDREMSSVDAN